MACGCGFPPRAMSGLGDSEMLVAGAFVAVSAVGILAAAVWALFPKKTVMGEMLDRQTDGIRQVRALEADARVQAKRRATR